MQRNINIDIAYCETIVHRSFAIPRKVLGVLGGYGDSVGYAYGVGMGTVMTGDSVEIFERM